VPEFFVRIVISIFVEIQYDPSVAQNTPDSAARFADMLAAMGTEPRLQVVRLLLAAHPKGLIAGDIGTELGIPASTLSHHLDRLKREGLVTVAREGTFLRYSANTTALSALLEFLFAECCTRTCAISPAELTFVRPERTS
jgi:ArsR family transcriptional regulator, arsenate/arsenite/antimonite-responsive transcriptional repressor